MIARRTRRMSSSLLPLNITPEMTSIQPLRAPWKTGVDHRSRGRGERGPPGAAAWRAVAAARAVAARRAVAAARAEAGAARRARAAAARVSSSMRAASRRPFTVTPVIARATLPATSLAISTSACVSRSSTLPICSREMPASLAIAPTRSLGDDAVLGAGVDVELREVGAAARRARAGGRARRARRARAARPPVAAAGAAGRGDHRRGRVLAPAIEQPQRGGGDLDAVVLAEHRLQRQQLARRDARRASTARSSPRSALLARARARRRARRA